MLKKIGFLVMLIVFLTGCQQYDIVKEDSQNYPIISPFPDKENMKVILYFPNAKYSYLASELRNIKQESTNPEKIIIEELMKGPKSSQLKKIIPESAKLISLDIEESIAYVNFTKALINENISETDEALLLYSIVNTVSNITDVEKVQILIEGKYRDVFCKYYKIGEPLDPTSFIVGRDYISPVETIRRYYESLKNKDYGTAAELLDLSAKKNINYSTIKTYLEKYYNDMMDFEIIGYTINKYETNLAIDARVDIYYYNNEKQSSEEIFNLFYKNGSFKIDKTLE